MYHDEVQQKEREYRDALSGRYQEAIDALSRRDADLKHVKDKFDVLERDFRYNLTLLADRDAELDSYEEQIQKLNATLRDKTRQLSDARGRLNDVALASRRRYLESDDARRLYESKMAEKDAQAVEAKREFEKELAKQSALLSTERAANVLVTNEAERRCRSINEQYAGVIYRRDEEHKARMEELSAKLQTEREQSAALRLELQTCQDQLVRLDSQATSSRIRQEESDVVQRCQVVDLRASLKNKDDLLNDARRKLEEAETKLGESKRELDELRRKPTVENMKTVDELNKLRQQNDVLKEVIKDMRKKNKRILEGDGNQESGGENEDLRLELKKVKQKVDMLLDSKDFDDEDERVVKLETAIAALKTHMMSGLRDKLSSDGEVASLEEVRILLLEQKLEQATENIGRAVHAEKNELLEEMKSVKTELMSRIGETLKSDAMMGEVRREIVRLEEMCSRDRTEERATTLEAATQVSPRTVPVVTRHPPEQDALRPVVTEHPPEQAALRPVVKPAVIHEAKTINPRMVTQLPKKRFCKLKVRNYNIQDTR